MNGKFLPLSEQLDPQGKMKLDVGAMVSH